MLFGGILVVVECLKEMVFSCIECFCVMFFGEVLGCNMLVFVDCEILVLLVEIIFLVEINVDLFLFNLIVV